MKPRQAATVQLRNKLTPGRQVVINSSCFIPEWVGLIVTVVSVGEWVRGTGYPVKVKTQEGKELTVVATSITVVN